MLQGKERNDGAGLPKELRSALWKSFLVTRNVDLDSWPKILGERRAQYATYREHYLKGPREDETDSFSDPLNEPASVSRFGNTIQLRL